MKGICRNTQEEMSREMRITKDCQPHPEPEEGHGPELDMDMDMDQPEAGTVALCS